MGTTAARPAPRFGGATKSSRNTATDVGTFKFEFSSPLIVGQPASLTITYTEDPEFGLAHKYFPVDVVLTLDTKNDGLEFEADESEEAGEWLQHLTLIDESPQTFTLPLVVKEAGTHEVQLDCYEHNNLIGSYEFNYTAKEA